MNKRGIVIRGKIERGTEGERARQLEWLESETKQSATFQSRTQHAAVESSSQFSPISNIPLAGDSEREKQKERERDEKEREGGKREEKKRKAEGQGMNNISNDMDRMRQIHTQRDGPRQRDAQRGTKRQTVIERKQRRVRERQRYTHRHRDTRYTEINRGRNRGRHRGRYRDSSGERQTGALQE